MTRPPITFMVPDDVPDRWTTAQLPEGERAPGRITARLTRGDVVVFEGHIQVDQDGVLEINVLPLDAEPGEYTLTVGDVLLRSMTLLPLRPE